MGTAIVIIGVVALIGSLVAAVRASRQRAAAEADKAGYGAEAAYIIGAGYGIGMAAGLHGTDSFGGGDGGGGF